MKGRYGLVQFLFNTGKMCKFSRTRLIQQIQFVRIPAEFVVRFTYQNHVKVIIFPIAAQYLLLISSHS